MQSEVLVGPPETVRVVFQPRKYAENLVAGRLQRQAGVERRAGLQPRVGVLQELAELRHAEPPGLRLRRHSLFHLFSTVGRRAVADVVQPPSARLSVRVRPRLERVAVVVDEPAPELDVLPAERHSAAVDVRAGEAAVAAGVVGQERVRLVDDPAHEEVDLLLVGVPVRPHQLPPELLDSVVSQLDDPLHRAVDVTDQRRGRVQQIEVDHRTYSTDVQLYVRISVFSINENENDNEDKTITKLKR